MTRLLVLMLLTAAADAAWAACTFIPAAEVAAAFPAYTPWEDRSSLGDCQFASPKDAMRPVNKLGVDLKIKRSAADAEQCVRAGRQTGTCQRTPATEPGLGAAAYWCRPGKGEYREGHAVYVIAHAGRIVASGTLATEKEMDDASAAKLAGFVRAGLAVAGDEAKVEALYRCEWLDAPTLAKLMPGKGMGQQSLEYDSCIAQTLDATLRVVTGDADDAEDLEPTRAVDCTTEPVAALGRFGSVSHDCSREPRAEAHVIVGTKFVEYVYEPGREPTAQERALLIELAKAVQAAHREPHR